MLCWMIILIFGLGYAYLFTFISDKLYFLPTSPGRKKRISLS